MWSVSILTDVVIVVTALQDPVFSKPLIHTTLISSTNSNYLIAQHYILLFIVICTTILDYMVFVKNKRYKNRQDDYNLSKSYQISENIVTLKFILPLDIAFALFLSTHLTGAVILRAMKSSVSPANFHACYDILYNIIHLHSLVTLLIFLRCAKYFKARPVMIEIDQHRVMYLSSCKRSGLKT
uniref:Uncharacterized protein n=1 Tax=Ditylenchus dipsaci TaxID=166011 RepID=A0A915EJJ6_9BILA